MENPNPPNELAPLRMLKKCINCAIEKPNTEFFTQKRKLKDGTDTIYTFGNCKECHKGGLKKYVKIPKEQQKKRGKQYAFTKLPLETQIKIVHDLAEKKMKKSEIARKYGIEYNRFLKMVIRGTVKMPGEDPNIVITNTVTA